MSKRQIGPFSVEAIGLGAMCLSHAYGRPPGHEEGVRLLHAALDQGYDFIDTAAIYGMGANEELIGAAIAGRRNSFVLASKCGMTGIDGKRVLDGRPATLLATIDAALKRLRTDHVDLYYLHRRDFTVPIEDSVGALKRMVEAGKVRAIGLSEVSADTLARAHAVHPIAALQTEYSPWSREAEIAVIDKTREIGAAFVAFSPVGRGFLADAIHDRGQLPEGDFRRGMPRFSDKNLPANLTMLDRFKAIASGASVTPAQLAIAWGLAKEPHIVSIPGTTDAAHLSENFAARSISLDLATVAAVDGIAALVAGPRYAPANQAEIDTETFT